MCDQVYVFSKATYIYFLIFLTFKYGNQMAGYNIYIYRLQ